MQWRKIKGLLGSAALWGSVGGAIGAAGYLTQFRVWPMQGFDWGRAFMQLGVFSGLGALWGAVCGVAFGLAVWRMGRRWSLESVSSWIFTAGGAIAGAAFPVLLYGSVVIARGIYSAIPFFGAIALVSAGLGGICSRALLAIARRTPTNDLPGSAPRPPITASNAERLDSLQASSTQGGGIERRASEQSSSRSPFQTLILSNAV